jgi:hypothetical protein
MSIGLKHSATTSVLTLNSDISLRRAKHRNGPQTEIALLLHRVIDMA